MYHKRLNAARERREKAAAIASARSGVLNQVLSPQDNEINRNIEGAVLDLRNEGRLENSSKALEPKKEEWLQYCDNVFPYDPFRYLVTSNKAYRFMCYQMFREAKPRGGKRSQLKESISFDLQDYTNIMSQFYTKDKEGAVSPWPRPSKLVDYSVYL